MTTAQAASRLRIDQSHVIKMINHGLVTGSNLKRLRLKATRKGHAWSITAEAVREFAAARKRLGI